MKLLKVLPVLFVAISMLLTSCSSASNVKLTTLYNATADLTRDGSKERIVRQIDGAENGDAAVRIYKKIGDENKLIWMDKLGTKKADQKGIYLCKKNGEYNMLIWKPTYKGDTTTLEYCVFYLSYNNISNTGSAVEEIYDTITFTDEQVTKDGDKYAEASDFVYTLNKYISRSAAMIDTVGGEMIYSPSNEEIKKNPYYPDWYDKSYKPEETTSSQAGITVSDSSKTTASTENAKD